MIGADQVFVNAASTVTKHYGQWWSYQGYDLTTKNAAVRRSSSITTRRTRWCRPTRRAS